MPIEDSKIYLNRIFPETKSILNREKITPSELRENALYVIDTNSLLAPYGVEKKTLEEIKKVYEKLISENRLFIPNHVLREFAKNRSIKISELYSNIDASLSKIPSLSRFQYPILSELDSYSKLESIRDKIQESLKEYKKHLTDLKEGITDWNWSDPISSIYSEIFSEEIFIDFNDISENDITEEFEKRIKDGIPPGNKDAQKQENAIGDFIIWKCILELGAKENKNIILVSNDEKNDWLLKGNKKSISTRFELVDEFYRKTEGRHFTNMTFQQFLESQGVDSETITAFESAQLESIRKKEILSKVTQTDPLSHFNQIKFELHLSSAYEILWDFYKQDSSYIKNSELSDHIKYIKYQIDLYLLEERYKGFMLLSEIGSILESIEMVNSAIKSNLAEYEFDIIGIKPSDLKEKISSFIDAYNEYHNLFS